ncbi:SLATT domain-containing protein [Methylocystis rosea]|uniref:SLATT domain-containing protein n=1 Tax=Methylocystis rosea TaxID=173366 RepID=A0A3G8M4R4_9HYPH|nr:SLATT domain-containing protein [Methylocystis rosea]AZG76315.1 SLATT domain-containing protein [Methylocystis rosea]
MEGDDSDQKLAATLQAITAEFRRIEEDCIHSGKAHFNAAARWNRYNYLLGLPSVVLSAAAGAAFFKDYPIAAGAMATTVSVLTGLMTFLKPSKIAGAHKNSGDQYLSLRNDARVFREIQLPQATTAQAATEAISSFTSRRNELNQASLQFSRRDFEKARKGISQGEATHAVDHGVL